MPAPYRHQWSQLSLNVQGAAGTQQGELAPALRTGTSRAAQPSTDPVAQLHRGASLQCYPKHNSWGNRAPFHQLCQAPLKAQKRHQDILLTLSTSGADLWKVCVEHLLHKPTYFQEAEGENSLPTVRWAPGLSLVNCCWPVLQKRNNRSYTRCTNNLWSVGLAAFRRASWIQEQHSLLNPTHNVPLGGGWECITCSVATHSTNSAIAITSLISQVNTQHSWGHKAHQTSGVLSGEGKEDKLILCLQFRSNSHPRSDVEVRYFGILLTITVQSAVGGTAGKSSVLCGHICRMYLGRKCTWFEQNISGYQVEEWDHVAYASLGIAAPNTTATQTTRPPHFHLEAPWHIELCIFSTTLRFQQPVFSKNS